MRALMAACPIPSPQARASSRHRWSCMVATLSMLSSLTCPCRPIIFTLAARQTCIGSSSFPSLAPGLPGRRHAPFMISSSLLVQTAPTTESSVATSHLRCTVWCPDMSLVLPLDISVHPPPFHTASVLEIESLFFILMLSTLRRDVTPSLFRLRSQSAPTSPCTYAHRHLRTGYFVEEIFGW